jgi:hypothetical protein
LRSIYEEETAIEIQHVNVKLLLEAVQLGSSHLDSVIPVFHSWIQAQSSPGHLLIDVADYRHVHHGPGILLIGHEADYAIDNTDGRLGLRYNRKSPLVGTNQEKLTQALRAALVAAQSLQCDTRLNGKLHFNGHDIEFYINDRLLAPNNDQTARALDPELRGFADRLLNGSEFTLRYESEGRRLFGVAIHFERGFRVEELVENLAV